MAAILNKAANLIDYTCVKMTRNRSTIFKKMTPYIISNKFIAVYFKFGKDSTAIFPNHLYSLY